MHRQGVEKNFSVDYIQQNTDNDSWQHHTSNKHENKKKMYLHLLLQTVAVDKFTTMDHTTNTNNSSSSIASSLALTHTQCKL